MNNIATGMDLRIRPGCPADTPAINAIFNYYVEHSTATWETELWSTARRSEWLRKHEKAGYPVLVAELNGKVAGWASLSAFDERPGFWPTVAGSIYVDNSAHRRGIGKALLIELIGCGRRAGHDVFVARISSDQDASRQLHEALGFSLVKEFVRGQKLNKTLHLAWYELNL